MAFRTAFALVAMAGLMGLHGCDSKDTSSGDPSIDQPAGEVVAVSGQVTASREGQPARELAVGEHVFRDDTVTTSGDGSIAIELQHNRVTWKLAGNQAMRVDQSLAWRAKPASGSGSFDERADMVTSSAGQHGGREAAVDAYALDSQTRQKGDTADLPMGSPETEASRAERVGSGGKASKSTGRTVAAKGASRESAPDHKDSWAELATEENVASALAATGQAQGASAAPKKEQATDPSEPEAAAESAPAPRPTVAARIGKVALHAGERRTSSIVQPLLAKVAACRSAEPSARMMVALTIAADGRVTSASAQSAQKVSADTRACILGAVRKLTFASSKLETRATVEIRFQN